MSDCDTISLRLKRSLWRFAKVDDERKEICKLSRRKIKAAALRGLLRLHHLLARVHAIVELRAQIRRQTSSKSAFMCSRVCPSAQRRAAVFGNEDLHMSEAPSQDPSLPDRALQNCGASFTGCVLLVNGPGYRSKGFRWCICRISQAQALWPRFNAEVLESRLPLIFSALRPRLEEADAGHRHRYPCSPREAGSTRNSIAFAIYLPA